MTVEQKYIFSITESYQEVLVINPDHNSIAHYLNDKYFQRLSLFKDKESGRDYVEYDWFKDDLWVGLNIYPAYQGTDLHDFYLGRFLKDNGLHGVRFTPGDSYIHYFLSDTASGYRTEDLTNEHDIDWKKLGSAKTADYSKALTHIRKDPSSGELSFAYRLVPAPYSPIAQVSSTYEFQEDTTIRLDTSYMLPGRDFDRLIIQTRILLEDNRSEARAQAFCDYLQMAFSDYFPMA